MRTESPRQDLNWRRWFFAAMLIAALVGALLHWGQIERFGALVRQARPAWPGLPAGLQFSTYS